MAASLSSAFTSSLKLAPATSYLSGERLAQPAAAAAAPASACPGVVRVVAVKKIQGTVVSTANNQTAAVEVKRIYAHKLYKKRITTIKRYQAHDPANQCRVGDFVTLAKCAPVSKTKQFVVSEIRSPRVRGAPAADAELPPLESAQS